MDKRSTIWGSQTVLYTRRFQYMEREGSQQSQQFPSTINFRVVRTGYPYGINSYRILI